MSVYSNNGVDPVRFIVNAVNEARECAADANAAAAMAAAYAAEAKEAAVHEPESMPADGRLTDRRVYRATCTDSIDLSALTVEPYGTCEVWVDYTAGSITWPDGWYWLDGTNSDTKHDHDVPPSMDTAGYRYRVVVRNEGDRSYARVAYKSAVPTA